ncbi:MAG: PAS domain-containing protein [Chloroflexi bacterium]|nr:PAS domain-containing protein [Chloroflexota bacterium]
MTTYRAVLQPLRGNLFLRSALLAAAVIIVVGAGILYAIRFPIEERIRWEATDDASIKVQSLARNLLDPHMLSGPLSGQEYERVDQAVRAYVLTDRVRRVKIWNPELEVIYSSLPSQMGSVVSDNDELHEALEGKTIYELGTPKESPDDLEFGAVIEAYFPVSLQPGAPPDIVAEVYIPYAPYAAIVASIQRIVLVAAALAGLIVCLALYFAYRTGWKAINREKNIASQRSAEMDKLYRIVATERGTLAAIQESMVEGLLVLDRCGKVAYHNQALEQLIGLSDGQIIGLPLRQVLEGRSQLFFEDNKTCDALLEALQKCPGGPLTIEVVMISPRHRVLSATAFPIPRDGQEPMSGLLLRDITEEREAEQRRDAFVSVASHELRTPMTAIVGFAELLRDRDPAPEVRREWLHYVVREGQRLTAIVEDMLNVSRIQSGKLTVDLARVDIRDIFRTVAGALQPTTANHRIVIEAPQSIPPVIADKDKLMQVIINLVSNAIKYSPNGGDVILNATSNSERAELVLSVADQGIGIAPEDRARLFSTFTRIRRPETEGIRGTGLGLYIVKGLVELMLGRIWLDSEVHKGSTFYVALPAIIPAQPVARASGATVTG